MHQILIQKIKSIENILFYSKYLREIKFQKAYTKVRKEIFSFSQPLKHCPPHPPHPWKELPGSAHAVDANKEVK